MNLSETYSRLIQLKEQIRFHNYRYHVLDDPVISDFEYDKLMGELRKIEEMHPDWVTSDSPTQRINEGLLDKFEKVRHPAPILSLSNAYNLEDLQAWLDRIAKVDQRVYKAEFNVEPKLDGLSVVLHYRNGEFVLGATRGDGEIGENITANLRTIKSLPLRIPISPGEFSTPPYLVVRGEVFFKLSDFEKVNHSLAQKREKTFVNPRNSAAGTVRQLDPSLTASRPLSLLVYQIVAGEGDFPDSQAETLLFLRKLGFPTPESSLHASINSVLENINAWAQKRSQLNYEIDGMVIKINDHKLYADLGIVGKDPRGATAFKFPAQEVTTKLSEIRVNVGRTGVLTPYAVLEPVEIGGVTVRQATLHNFDYISEKDIRVGDRVTIKRAGDVIPYVIGPVISARSGEEKIFIPPTHCPDCGEAVENQPGEVAWFCVNSGCPAQLIRNLEHFASRDALDIAGLGIKIVEQLVTSKLVSDAASLYFLKKEDLLTLEGFAGKKADNLIEAINLSKQQPLWRLINALGIRGVGSAIANDLSQSYSSLEFLAKADIEELTSIEGIGPNIAHAIVDWFSLEHNKNMLGKLKIAGMWPESSSLASPHVDASLEGKTFVVTGTLPTMSRQAVEEFITQHGGKVTDSVSKKTTYLVLGENPGSKHQKAQSLGVQIIDEDELLRLAKHNEVIG